MNQRRNGKRKKILSLALAIIIVMLTISGCNKNPLGKTEDKVKIVCTTFAIYDWVIQLTNGLEDYEVLFLLKNGSDAHNYQPTVEDIVEISSCDLFLYVGGESDAWVEPALKEAKNKQRRVLNFMELLEPVREEMLQEPEPRKEEHEEEEHDHADEHVWLSLKNAQIFVEQISNVLLELEENRTNEEKRAENIKQIQNNQKEYSRKLKNLEEQYRTVVEDAKTKVLLFADRFPFAYLIEDYQLEYYAAFDGCSTETEASFETIAFLAQKIQEHNLSHVLVLEESDREVAKSVIRAAKRPEMEILELNSLQAVAKNAKDITYLSMMQRNLEILKEALN